MSKLIPIAYKRCQAEYLAGSFMTLGPRQMRRCPNASVWIAKEISPGEDGQRGSMCLCDECKPILIKKFGRKYCTFVKIKGDNH